MDTKRIYYVYIHRRPTDLKVFYVGKGKNKRAWTKKDRNPHWANVVNKHGITIQILKGEMTEQEAFELEEQMILHYGINNLTNQTLGGHTSTGYKHTEETRKLQSEICKQRIENSPEFAEMIRKNMAELHDRQRNDENYKKEMSARMKAHHNSLDLETKQILIDKRTAWAKSPEGREHISTTAKLRFENNPELKISFSKKTKEMWRSLTEEEYAKKVKVHTEILTSEHTRQRLRDTIKKSVVVNRKMFVDTCDDLNTLFNSTAVANSLKNAVKKGYIGTIYRGYLLEYYDEEVHSNVSDNAEIIAYPFLSLPLKFGVVKNDTEVFLSSYQAAREMGREGRKVETTGDWLSTKARNGETAFGSNWRVASINEINSYLISIYEGGENE